MKWEQPPPPPQRARRNWTQIAEELTKHPNQWASVGGYTQYGGAVTAFKLCLKLRLESAEHRIVKTGPRRYVLYVRYALEKASRFPNLGPIAPPA